MGFKLVFIDDNMKDGTADAFVRAIGKKIPDAEIAVFIDPDEGLNYIIDNINSQLIAFVDCKFDGYTRQGIDILKEIRKKTSLLYIVMMSANNLKQIDGRDIAAMINEDFIWFYDRNNGSVEDACTLIHRITQYWSSRFDCVLERWLVRHREDKNKIDFRQLSGSSYTWEQILIELRLQTEIGHLFEQMINQFYIYQLNGKEDE